MGNIYDPDDSHNLNIKTDTDDRFSITQAGKVGIGKTGPSKELEVVGDISASGGIYGGTATATTGQPTGSYDFPGAIMGYTCLGNNLTHTSYNLTTSYTVPDDKFSITFKAPKSGVVELEVQVYADGGSNGLGDVYFGLSDQSATDGYNAVQSYYEQGVWGQVRYDHMVIVHKWLLNGLNPGETYKYWFGAKATSTLGTPKLCWSGNSANRFPDFIMKATALPSNSNIET